MNDYYFYRYRFKPVPSPQTLPLGPTPQTPPTPLNLLDGRLSARSLPVIHRCQNGRSNQYNNRIFYHGGVGLMQLQNNISFTRTDQNFHTAKDTDYPYTNIIIDNRPGRQMIAIERSDAFRPRRSDHAPTQRVAGYIEESVSEYLNPWGHAMELTPVARQGDIWPTIISRIRDGGQRVRSIEFMFPSEHEATERQPRNALHLLMHLARQSGASDGRFRMDYRNGDETEMQQTERNFKATEILLARERFRVNVQFTDMSVIRSDRMLYAHRDLPERDLANFIGGQTALDGDFELNHTLDILNDTLNDYER